MRDELTRRAFLWRAGLAAGGLSLARGWPPAAPAAAQGAAPSGWTAADYWAFAGRHQVLLDGFWSPQLRCYAPGGHGETSVNANLLFTHAAAARAGAGGPARNDERARLLAQRLCESPPWRPGRAASDRAGRALAAAGQTHDWGWGFAMGTRRLPHVVIDTVVVRALAQAFHARAELALPEETARAISDRVGRAATSSFYAYPALRLNQINWPVEIYAHAAAVTGDVRLLRRDARRQLARFADGLTRPAPGNRIPHLGAGYRFHYLPGRSAQDRVNVDSAEYACIVCGALAFYASALAAGMRPLSSAQIDRLRAWVERVLCGYWTHGGYLNWDTGMGFARWHQAKKLGLAQAALLAIALAPAFQPTQTHGRWAKALLDRGFAFFDRLVGESGGLLPPAVLFDVTETKGSPSDAVLFAARMQANAAQAAISGLGAAPSELPGPLYAHDPDTGRLAVTTPAYNTAVVPVNQGAFPYGGMELARLFDGDQRVAAGIGGRPPASFGVLVRDLSSGRVTATQRGRRRPDLERPPLRLVRAPRGAVARPRAYPAQPYAGPFDELEAVGTTRGADVAIRTRHVFRAGHVETSWRLSPRRRAGSHAVDVLFPTWGAAATVTAALLDGQRLGVDAGDLPLAGIAWFHLAGEDTGYVVALRSRPLPGRAHLLRPPPQPSAPRPGPTLALGLSGGGPLAPLTVTVRLAPARDAAHAELVAQALRS
jgi:hypothetical protein